MSAHRSLEVGLPNSLYINNIQIKILKLNILSIQKIQNEIQRKKYQNKTITHTIRTRAIPAPGFGRTAYESTGTPVGDRGVATRKCLEGLCGMAGGEGGAVLDGA